MTLADSLFLAAVVAAFATFMGLLVYGLIVAGDSAESSVTEAAAPPAAAPLAGTRTAKAADPEAHALEDAT